MRRVIVVDTSVLVGALTNTSGAEREVLRRCLRREYGPLMGAGLLEEMEDGLGRVELMRGSPAKFSERERLFRGFLSVCCWTHLYYLQEREFMERDEQLVELAMAGGAETIVTNNAAEVKQRAAGFPDLRIVTPMQMVSEEN